MQQGVLLHSQLNSIGFWRHLRILSRHLEQNVPEPPHKMASGVYVELTATFRGTLAGKDLRGQDISIGGLRTGCDTSL